MSIKPHLFISCMVQPAIDTSKGILETICSTSEDVHVHILQHRLHDRLIGHLVVVIEAASVDFSHVCVVTRYLDLGLRELAKSCVE